MAAASVACKIVSLEAEVEGQDWLAGSLGESAFRGEPGTCDLEGCNEWNRRGRIEEVLESGTFSLESESRVIETPTGLELQRRRPGDSAVELVDHEPMIDPLGIGDIQLDSIELQVFEGVHPVRGLRAVVFREPFVRELQGGAHLQRHPIQSQGLDGDSPLQQGYQLDLKLGRPDAAQICRLKRSDLHTRFERCLQVELLQSYRHSGESGQLCLEEALDWAQVQGGLKEKEKRHEGDDEPKADRHGDRQPSQPWMPGQGIPFRSLVVSSHLVAALGREGLWR